MDLEAYQLEAFLKAYSYLDVALLSVTLLVETYFVDIPVETYKTITGLKGISAIGFDFIRGSKTLGLIKEAGFPADKVLFAGVVDGRNIWANDLADSLSVLESLENIVGKGNKCMHFSFNSGGSLCNFQCFISMLLSYS
jgi:5-methyltetrahydropteroyltriglutamate--homocysteine methyltransferase